MSQNPRTQEGMRMTSGCNNKRQQVSCGDRLETNALEAATNDNANDKGNEIDQRNRWDA